MMFGLAGSAIAALLLAFVSELELSSRKSDEKIGQIVLKSFQTDVTAAHQVKVTTKEGTYHLQRDGMTWNLVERANYPIQLRAIADLSDALSSMTYSRPMTADPKKFDSLGLGDPLKAGTGALMEVFDERGTSLANLIVGFKNGAAYIRAPEDEQTWAVDASRFPPLQNPARWLNLNVMPIGVGDIARVEVENENGEPYALKVRYDKPGHFRLQPPYHEALLLTDYAANQPALALARFKPLDAVERSQISAQKVATTRTITHQGLVIETEILRNEDGFWAVFSGSLEVDRDNTSEQLADIEEGVAGWAFKMSRLDFEAFTTSLDDIITR
jgi:hypothetical protein